MLATRVLTAVVLIPVVVLPLWRGGFLFVLLVAMAAALALREFYGLVRAGGVQPATLLGALGLALMLIGAGVPDQRVQDAAVVVLVLGGLLWALADPAPEGKLAGWALTAAGAFYVGWPLAHAVELRALPNGFGWLVVTLVATWATDTGAYFAGRFFGRHPFSPRYSPKKTWEGVVGGWLLGLLVTVALTHWLLDLPLGRGVLLGVLLGPAAVYGDLVESMLKRLVAVKDSGTLIPGHGGMLDRIDSLLFTAVVTYYFAYWLA